MLIDFSDKSNDAPLFIGWLDYLSLTGKLPIEVQVFQVWWFALNEDKLNPETDPAPYRTEFPSIAHADRREQKRQLRRSIEKYRQNRALLADPKTETHPLLIRVHESDRRSNGAHLP